LASFIFSVGLAFVPAGVIVFVITEKIEGVKRSQFVSGVSMPTY